MLKLLKVMATMASASLLGQILGIFTNKILAVVMGPAGVGMYGLYRQLIDIAANLASIGSGGGFVQAMSSTEGDAQLRRLAAAIWLNFLAILLTSLVMIFFAPSIARIYFVQTDPTIRWAVVWLGVPVALIQFALVASNLLGVSQAFRLLGIVMVAPALASLVFSYPLAILAAQDNQWGYIGLLMVPPALQILVALPILHRLGWLRQIGASFHVKPRRADILHYVRFHGTTLVAALASSVTFLILPPLLIHNHGAEANGYFRAAWMLGMQSLALMLNSFGAYIMPVLGRAKVESERHKVMDDALLLAVLFSLPLIGGLIIFQPLVIRILYNQEFLPSIEMLHWVLLGSYFRIVQWILVIGATARAHMTIFTVTEVVFYFGFFFIGWLSVGFPVGGEPIPWLSGIRGLGFAYFVSIVVTSMLAVAYSRQRYRYFPPLRTVLVWFLGLAVIALCAFMTWNEWSINWPLSLALSLLCCATSALLLDARRRSQLKKSVVSILITRSRNGAPD
jgi:O-antigen/teichoic acid export membrane protein